MASLRTHTHIYIYIGANLMVLLFPIAVQIKRNCYQLLNIIT